MSGDNRQDAYTYLLNLAARQGYVTFDDIIDASEQWQLPINEVDWLANSIATRGVLVYNEAPEKTNRITDEDNYDDFAQIDYEKVFSRIIEIEPSLEPFVNEVREIKPPQYKEFASIIYQAKEGNEYAINRIIEMHLRQVLRFALQRAEQYDADLIDCVGDACIGLLAAIEKFDPDISGSLGAYAGWWMLQSISRIQPTQRPSIYYSVYAKERYFAMYPSLRDNGCTSCERIWSCKKIRKKIMERLNCSSEQADEVVLQVMPLESYEALTDDIIQMSIEQESYNHDYDLIAKNTVYQYDMDADIEYEEMHEAVDSVLKTLKKREQEVIRGRFGFIDGKQKTLEEIGSELGVTRERIRQIEMKALRKLSQPSKLKKLSGYL